MSLLQFLKNLLSDPSPSNAEKFTYVKQILSPLGGEIQRPKDWHYKECHQGSMLCWTISREDTQATAKPYQVGTRIQVFTGIEKGTGKTAKAFMLGILERQAAAGKVVRRIPQVDQGLFTRIGMEIIEGPYRVLYSLFWASSGGDFAVSTVSGTPTEEWEKYRPVFDTMSDFQLLSGDQTSN